MTHKLKRHSMDGENWFRANWRNMAAWVYLAIVVFDFVIAPILLGAYSLKTHTVLEMWKPLTLEGGGIFHLSFGAILGVSAYTRGQEILQTNAINSSMINNGVMNRNPLVPQSHVPVTNVTVNEYDVTNYKKQ